MRILLFAAFPQELEYVLNGCGAEGGAGVYRGGYRGTDVVAVLTGMGAKAAARAFEAAYERYGADLVVSTGYAGALYEGASIGDIVMGRRSVLFDGTVMDDIRCGPPDAVGRSVSGVPGVKPGTVVTINRRLAKTDILKRLPPGLDTPVCDMETHALARQASCLGLPFLSLRSITDTLKDEIPGELFEVCDATGSYSAASAVKTLVKRPWLIPAAARLGMGSKAASKALWSALKSLMDALRDEQGGR